MLLQWKRIALLTGILVLALSYPYSAAYPSEDVFFDYHGMAILHGDSRWTGIGPTPIDEYTWSSINYILGKDLTSWLAVETWLGLGDLDSENFGESHSLEARILAALHYGCFFLKAGGGTAHLFDDDNLPGLAPANIYGIISGSVGFRKEIRRRGKPPLEITLGYGVEHISAYNKHGEDGDDGWNTGGIYLSLTWPLQPLRAVQSK